MALKAPTIAIIGAGWVGATTAYTLAQKNIASHIMLVDIDKKKAESEVMDIEDSLRLSEVEHITEAHYKQAAKADFIIIACGSERKLGSSRLDQIDTNADIVRDVLRKMGRLRKESFLIMVSNPVDILTAIAVRESGLPLHHVIGTGTILDTARLQCELSRKLGISNKSIQAMVIAEHGDSSVIPWSSITIAQKPLKDYTEMDSQAKKEIEKKVHEKAYTIVNGKGATFFGIASCISEIIESIVYDQKKVLPVSTYVESWMGIENICFGIPCIIGADGREKVCEIPLSKSEYNKVLKSAKILQKYMYTYTGSKPKI